MIWFNPFTPISTILERRVLSRIARGEWYHNDMYAEELPSAVYEFYKEAYPLELRDYKDLEKIRKKIKYDKDGIINEPDTDISMAFPGLGEYIRMSYRRRRPFTQKERDDILFKKGSRCVVCEKCEDLQIHHINGIPTDNNIDNLEVVCYSCHKRIHKKKQVVSE